MKEVSREEFFATVGQMDVHPRTVDGSDYRTSVWETRNRVVVGKSVKSSTYPIQFTYFVSTESQS